MRKPQNLRHCKRQNEINMKTHGYGFEGLNTLGEGGVGGDLEPLPGTHWKKFFVCLVFLLRLYVSNEKVGWCPKQEEMDPSGDPAFLQYKVHSPVLLTTTVLPGFTLLFASHLSGPSKLPGVHCRL